MQVVSDKGHYLFFRLLFLTISFLLFIFILSSAAVNADNTDVSKWIVILFPSNETSDWNLKFSSGFFSYLDKDNIQDYRVSIEYLDVGKQITPESDKALVDDLKRIKEKYDPDLIISILPLINDLIYEYGEEIFPDTPKIFAPTLKTQKQKLLELPDAYIIDSSFEYAIRNTLLDIVKMLPNLKQLHVITGSGEDNILYLNGFKEIASQVNPGFSIIYHIGTPIAELIPIVNSLPENSAIYFLIYNKDTEGNNYNFSNFFPPFSRSANSPIYAFHDLPFGMGALGGEMTSSIAYGRLAAETAVNVLQNNPLEQVIRKQAIVSQYDWREMKRWDIDEALLPENAEIVFRDESFFMRYRKQIILIIILVSLQMALIIALIINLSRRYRAENALKLSEKLLDRSERTALLGGWDYNIETKKINYTKELLNIFGIEFSDEISLDNLSNFIYPDFRERFIKAVEQIIIDGKPFELELRIKKADGNSIWISAKAEAIKKNGRITGITGTLQNINLRKMNELKLQNTILVKDSLLKEIHHRVKNNLTIIISLLNIQEGCIDDDKIKEELIKSEHRVRAISLIHEQLYLENDLDNIRFSDYVQSIALDLSSIQYSNIAAPRITFNIPDIKLEIDVLVPIGLIINEVISNSLEHAFSDTLSPQIKISVKQLPENKFLLLIRDNGSGLPQGFDPKSCSSVGMILIHNLVLQINGKFNIRSENGTRCEIIF